MMTYFFPEMSLSQACITRHMKERVGTENINPEN